MLDWEENLFLGIKALYRQAFVRPEERRRAGVRATLKELRPSLLLLGQMIAGRPLAIFETSNAQLSNGDRIFLPTEFSLANSRAGNLQYYELKALLGALAIRDQWHPNNVSLHTLVTRYQEELPHLLEKINTLKQTLAPELDLWATLGHLPNSPSIPGPSDDAALPSSAECPPGQEATTEIEGQGQAHVTVLPPQDDDGPGADLPMHTFEKVETLEEYSGESRKSDADDELHEHEEALKELKMSQVIRSPERPRSIYRSDIILEGPSFEARDSGAQVGLPYPEWDHRKRQYRPNWCFVQPQRVTLFNTEWAQQAGRRHRRLIQQLKRQFATLISDWLHLKRQTTGSEFDLDAVVDSETARRSGQTPSEAIYLDRRRDLHDLSILILLDQSYSTEGWLNNQRILDVIRETVFCVGEVLHSYLPSFAVAGFSSNTRRSCRFDLVKDFREPWAATRGRLGSLQPCGYTRIGPALRHAQELLASETAAHKGIVLITDGRPCDYDHYEGTYGIQDVRHALETGRQHGIQSHAFAVEKRAAEYFPRMFTQHHYDIVPNPDQLARILCRRFARWMAG